MGALKVKTRGNDFIYIAYETEDKFEFIVSVADTLVELSKTLNIKYTSMMSKTSRKEPIYAKYGDRKIRVKIKKISLIENGVVND